MRNAIAVMLLVVLAACAAHTANTEPPVPLAVQGQVLAVPSGVDSELMASLGAELERVLALPRTASSMPTPHMTPERTADGDDAILSWSYNNSGDYDQNSEVNVGDLTPIGANFGAVTGAANWEAAQVADGDLNGEVNIADVTPIGQGFGNVFEEFVVESADDTAGPWTEVDRVLFAAGVLPTGGGFLEYGYTAVDGATTPHFRVHGEGTGGSITPPPPDGLTNIFWLHHSTGEGIVAGGLRAAIADYNTDHGTEYEFWDQAYNYQDLLGPDGTRYSDPYQVPNDDTDPYGLWYLWTSSESDATTCRNQILDNHEVIAFKSCFPSSAIWDADELQERQDYYLDMRDFFDMRLDRLFVVMSTPPLRTEETEAPCPANARAFANWLKSAEYLNGHPNVVCYDIFDALASDGSDGPANTLRTSFCTPGGDSHPNDLANQTVAPLLAEFLCDAAGSYDP